MKHLLKYLFVCLTLCAFVGCDCQYQVTGLVLDSVTASPISDVSIGKTDTVHLDNPFNRKSFTDGNGAFDILGVGGRCNEITLFFMHPGYETQEITLETFGVDTIYLTRK